MARQRLDPREKRLAENEMFFREVNEETGKLAGTHGRGPHVYEFICECSNTECSFRLPMTLAEYECVRASGRRFAILPDHFLPEIERVVERRRDYWVIEKLDEAAAFVEAHDPRRD